MNYYANIDADISPKKGGRNIMGFLALILSIVAMIIATTKKGKAGADGICKGENGENCKGEKGDPGTADPTAIAKAVADYCDANNCGAGGSTSGGIDTCTASGQLQKGQQICLTPPDESFPNGKVVVHNLVVGSPSNTWDETGITLQNTEIENGSSATNKWGTDGNLQVGRSIACQAGTVSSWSVNTGSISVGKIDGGPPGTIDATGAITGGAITGANITLTDSVNRDGFTPNECGNAPIRLVNQNGDNGSRLGGISSTMPFMTIADVDGKGQYASFDVDVNTCDP